MQPQLLIQRLMANKHTSGAGLVFMVCVLIGRIAKIWFPQHAVEIKETMDSLKEFAVAYGFIMGADANKGLPGEEPPKPPGPNVLKISAIVIFIIGLSTALIGCCLRK